MSALRQPVRLFSGADAVKAADKLRRVRQNQELWPYVHVYPPTDSIPVNQNGYTAVGAIASTVVPLTYQVPQGYTLILAGIVNDYTGGDFKPGAALWTVDLNRPLGVTNAQFQPVQGLTAVGVKLGTFLNGPWWFARAYEFAPLDTLRVKATNVSLSAGDPNYFSSAFLGWLLPAIKAE